MYEYIQGKLTSIKPTYIVVDIHGVGYRLLCPNPYHYQKEIGNEIRVYVEQFIRDREGTIEIFAFKDESEKELFQTLIKVSGIGPKSALSILAVDDHIGLMNAIESGDSKYLMSFPGVGKKTAQQMILDLRGELILSDQETTPKQNTSLSHKQHLLEEVCEALEGLGYSQREIKRIEPALGKLDFETTQEALSQAFKLLIKT